MQKIDGAFQLLMAGQDGALLAGVDAEELQEAAHEAVDGDQHWPEDRDEKGERARHYQRHAVGIIDRHRLRHDFREDEHQNRHEAGRVNRALVADEGDENAGREGRRADIDERVAEQARADHAIAARQQPVDEDRAAVALLFERVHARARSRGQRRLRGGEKGRQSEAEKDDGDRDPQGDR